MVSDVSRVDRCLGTIVPQDCVVLGDRQLRGQKMNLLLSNVHEFIGREVAATDWIELDQMQVNIFGEITRCGHGRILNKFR